MKKYDAYTHTHEITELVFQAKLALVGLAAWYTRDRLFKLRPHTNGQISNVLEIHQCEFTVLAVY